MSVRRTSAIFLTGLFLLTACSDGGNQNLPPTGSGGSGGTGGGPGIQIEKPDNAIEGQYIFALDGAAVTADMVQAVAEALAAAQGGALLEVYNGVMTGFMANGLDDEKALAIAKDPRVKGIMQDCVYEVNEVQGDAPWGLDRIDQTTPTLDKNFIYNAGNGAGVHVYVLDTGIRRTHEEFGDRAIFGMSSIADGFEDTDCQGHGTHVAGIVAGKTYGVAKGANVVSIRTLGCNGSSSAGYVLKGIDAITAGGKKPAVVNMSLGGPANTFIDDAVRFSIQQGFVYVVAAGNFNKDACLLSPARIPEVITVGATDPTDTRAPFSNWGSCVDIFAPGVDIDSASKTSDTTVATGSGTSQATPYVAGVAALYMALNPAATQAEVNAALLGGATPDLVKDPMGSTNKLLYSRFMEPKTGFQDTKIWGEYAVGDVPDWLWQSIRYADANGDGLDDLCMIIGADIDCLMSDGSGGFSDQVAVSVNFPEQYWAVPNVVATIRHPDLNGDKKADVCWRAPNGIACGLSVGAGFDLKQWDTYYADSSVWDDAPAYWGTIQYPDLNGDGMADVCGRASNGIVCQTSNGTSFTNLNTWTGSFSDADGWAGADSHWGTIAFPDLNGDGMADVCGRSTLGIACGLSLGTGFGPVGLWDDYFTNGGVWDDAPAYWSSIKYIDIDGDKKTDVCGRANNGIVCKRSTGTTFGPTELWTTEFSDDTGWGGTPAHWATIHYADVNGDGRADVCGRATTGVVCALSTGTSFAPATMWEPNFSDESGWAGSPSHYGTLRYPDLNGDGKADICGRSVPGIVCGTAP